MFYITCGLFINGTVSALNCVLALLKKKTKTKNEIAEEVFFF